MFSKVEQTYAHETEYYEYMNGSPLLHKCIENCVAQKLNK